ncbi:unnamed protein product [Phyllotreta striolata]|uniref:Peptidase S1 domain-containing protein n=1 Tax=Phyllotreta striolata TaxID=444603 RepID=A0A9N9TDJ3_PHYSR|nr:unnamed protein product [Phyllotreta striolata]
MNTAIVILAVLGTALAASIEQAEFPANRRMEIDPIRPIEESEHPNLQIINGHEVPAHSIPYQVYLIGKSSQQSWSCGGSLITRNYVLTAAHCVDGASSIQVTLGAHNLRVATSGRISVNAKSWKQHEEYNSRTIDNDVAVIRLPSPITLSSTINLSPLPNFSEVAYDLDGLSGRVSGWGLTGSGKGSDVLLAVNNTVISNTQCNSYYGVVKSREICLSGAGRKTACSGDSGGPMIIGNKQYGIVSYGARDCPSGYPGVYARVDRFLDWIENNSDWRPRQI